VDDAEATVRNLATEIVASLTRTMAVFGVVQVPPFNEVTWTHYPKAAATSPPTAILPPTAVSLPW